ncbi:MAG: HAD-IA family hydrolase [Alphaproteobacteria bacterium]|nr:HAD-IA family hydrolase [Alphaproteobacteria bacterium]
MVNKKQIIVFDLDGTLINSAPDLCYALNKTLEEINIPLITLQEVMGYLGDGALELIKRGISKHHNIDNYDLEKLRIRFLDIYDDCLLDKTDFYENVIETLEKLKQMNFTLAICSNKPELLAKRIIKGLNAMHYFDTITGGDTYEFRKPDSRHLEKTILDVDRKVEQAIMVGDSENDIKCANSINIPSIVVDFGYSKIPVKNLNATIIMNNYRNLIMHIQEINNN